MEKLASVPTHITALQTAEVMVRRLLSLQHASPFLAHCEFSAEQHTRYRNSFRRFVDGDAGRIAEALRRWPVISAWNIAIALSEGYGGDGSAAVYDVLNRSFGVSISIDDRSEISRRFRNICREHGLCHKGTGRLVDDYLAQAGIANSQLHHVARAFLAAERAFGRPPADSTVALNSWEDDSTAFLPPGIQIPRMVLEVDETAYYAFLYVRYRNNEQARSNLERQFFEEIKSAEQTISANRQRSLAFPRPMLVWTDGGLALSLPKVEGRLALSLGAETKRLRGGQTWQLPAPWPSHINCEILDQRESIAVFPSADDMLVFDAETGRLTARLETARCQDATIDSREIVLLATQHFSVDDQAAYPLGLGGYACHCTLGSQGMIVDSARGRFQIRSRPKPRIWIESGLIAKGSRGALLGAGASLGIEFGELEGDEFDLAVSVGLWCEIVPVTRSPAANCAVYDVPSDLIIGSDVQPLLVELRFKKSERALLRFKAWVWPGLRGLVDGLVFDSDAVPGNLSAHRSRHISTDSQGRLILDPDTAYDKALLCFESGGERVEFKLPRPGVGLNYTAADGTSVPLVIGAPLVVREEDKAGSIAIRCPDRFATLDVRGRVERQPFLQAGTRILSLAELLGPGSRDDVVLLGSMPGAAPLTLTRIVPALCPSSLWVGGTRDTVEIVFELPAVIDAVRLEFESEIGDHKVVEYALMHRPVSGDCPSWLKAELDPGNYHRVEILLDESRAEIEDVMLGQIFVRPAGSSTFRPLRKLRGDIVAVLFVPQRRKSDQTIPRDEISLRYSKLNGWMMQCYASECWEAFGESICDHWVELGEELLSRTDSFEQLLASAHGEIAAGVNKSWVPLAHPLQFVPSLYGAPLDCFRSLAAETADGCDHLAILADVAGRNIPQIHREIGLSLSFMSAFGNFLRALQTNEQLRGFDFVRYKKLVSEADTDTGARWFWQPGDALLGPEHHGAAIGRLIDRLFDAGLDQDGFNDLRFRRATSVAKEASKTQTPVLALPREIEATYPIIEWGPAFYSAFARHSRSGTVKGYLTDLSNSLSRPLPEVASDASFLVRLAPELLAFYLLLWELADEGRSS